MNIKGKRMILLVVGFFLIVMLIKSTLAAQPIVYPRYYDISDPDTSYYYYYFDDPMSVLTVTKMGEGSYNEVKTFYDGFGRVIQVQTKLPNGKALIVNTAYNGKGLEWRVSKPYESSGEFGIYEQPIWDNQDGVHYYTEKEYDSLGRLKRVYNYDGTYVEYEYGADWERVIDETGVNYLKTIRDAYGKPLDVENSMGYHTISNYYDPLGLRFDVINPMNQVIKTQNDMFGNMRVQYSPDFGVRRNIKYDAAGNLLVSSDGCDPFNIEDYSSYDPSNYGCKRVIAYSYDSLDRLRCIDYDPVDPNGWNGSDCSGAEVYYYYDDYENAPDCNVDIEFNYPVGRLVEVKDYYNKEENPYYECYYYDIRGQVRREVRHIDGVSYELDYEYDNVGNLVNIIYPNGEGVAFVYDGVNRLDRVLSETGMNKIRNPSFEINDGIDYMPVWGGDNNNVDNLPDGWAFSSGGSFTLDPNYYYGGEKSLKIYGSSTSYAYQDVPIALKSGMTYKIEGYVKTNCNSGDCFGVILPQCADNDHGFRSECDLFLDINDPLVQSQKVTGDSDWTLVTYTLNLNNVNPDIVYLRVVCYKYGSGNAWCDDINVKSVDNEENAPVLSDYEYNSDNTLKEERYGNDVLSSYEYTPRNWISQISVSGFADDKLIRENYEYDPVGNLVYLTESEGINNEPNQIVKKTKFIYDNLYRLTRVEPVNLGTNDFWGQIGRYADTLEYEYDALSNLMRRNNLVFNLQSGSNRLQSADLEGVYYNNDLVGVSYTYDPFGNLVKEDGWQEIGFYSIRNSLIVPSGEGGYGGTEPKKPQYQQYSPVARDLDGSNLTNTSDSSSDRGGDYIKNESTRVVEGEMPKENEPLNVSVSINGSFEPIIGENDYGKFYIYGVDAEPGEEVLIVHYVNTPPYDYAYDDTYVWKSTVLSYDGDLGPYCDRFAGGYDYVCDPEDSYRTIVEITADNLVSNNGPPGEFYNQFQNGDEVFHLMKQYFHVYKQKTIKYCFDNGDRLLFWTDSDNRCMKFEYDESGNRIKKTVIDGDSGDGEITVYIMQGNNVIYENSYIGGGLGCPDVNNMESECPYYVESSAPLFAPQQSKDIWGIIKEILFSSAINRVSGRHSLLIKN
jgi:YD repeat-containing protein